MTPDFTLFAAFGALAALWSQFRALLDRLRGCFIQRTAVEGRVGTALQDYLFAQARCFRWGDTSIQSRNVWVRPREKRMEVAFEKAPISPVVTLWQRRLFIFQAPRHSEVSGGMTASDCFISVWHLRGTLDVKSLIREALDWVSRQETTGRRYRVYNISGQRSFGRGMGHGSESNQTHGGGYGSPVPISENERHGIRFLHYTQDDIGEPRPTDPYNSYVLSTETRACRQDFMRWTQLKPWYQQRGIPWRRGHLLYGPPGTGKTALVRALAQEADFPVFAYDLSTLDNDELRSRWQDMQQSAPCIALIEDIDGVFHGRTNVLSEKEGMRSSLTFDCLLNVLGGIQTADGIFTFITTNQPETLDAAIGIPAADGTTSRPGRCDRAFLIPLPCEETRTRIINRICDTCTPADLAATDLMTASQVTEYAILHALGQTWNSQS